MLDSFNIKITKLVKLPQVVIDNYPEEYGSATDIVTAVHFTYSGTKNGIITERPGMVGIPFVKNEETYIPFSELKPENVIVWIESVIGEEKLDEVKSEIEVELDTKHQETLDSKLPWEQ